MTRYTVVWHPVARDLLTEMWLVSMQREEITTAGNALDRELAIDALEKGESIGPRFRRLVMPPVEAFFEVREQDRLVRIVHIRRIEISQLGISPGNGNGNGPTSL